MRAVLITLLVVGFACTVSAGSISFVGEGFIPEPNQEVTVQIQTDTPLLCMDACIAVTGDATITTAMNTADCNQYGWDPSWPSDPYIDPNGWVEISGVKWESDANGVVGYFKFVYHSGEVTVSFTADSVAFDANCLPVLFSTDTLIFGIPDPNQNIENNQHQTAPQEDITERVLTENIDQFPLSVLQKPVDRARMQLCPSSNSTDLNSWIHFKEKCLASNQPTSSLLSGQITDLTSQTELFGLESNVIVINSDITTNQVWSPDNVYYVTTDVHVQALLVIEPNTTVYFGYYGTLWVNNGGTLISRGTPDESVYYLSDGYPSWGNYYYAIVVEETASPATTITYSYVEAAIAGIVTLNIRLDHPIENNYFYKNIWGLGVVGTKHTDIRNNLFYYGWTSGIDVYLASTDNIADANSHILIENNTCDYYQDNGITIHGVPDGNSAGLVVLSNNIVSDSWYYGLNLVDGYMRTVVTHTGYYGNWMNKNWEFEEDNPIEANDYPYVEAPGYFDSFFLNQACPFINAGSQYIEQTSLAGTTTDANGIPDSNCTDLGFHYPNWSFSNAGTGLATGDINRDSITDYKDLHSLASDWLHSGTGDPNDLNNDGKIDFKDYALLAKTWRKIQGYPNITLAVSGDSNSGYVDAVVSGFSSDTQRVFLLVDGCYIGELYGFNDGETIPVDISVLDNGTHQLKAIGLSTTGQITCSNLKQNSFNCFLKYCFSADAYDLNESHHFCAYYSGSSNISVKVYDEENNLVWSQTYSGQNLNSFIPPSITSARDLNSIVFQETPSSGNSITKPLGLKFKPAEVPANVRALLVWPFWTVNWQNQNVNEVVKEAFDARGVPYWVLKWGQASYTNLAWFGANRNLDYIYYVGHGVYNYFGGELRSGIQLSDGFAASVKQSDFAPGQAPSWCKRLPGNWENTVNSIALIGFPQGRLKYIHFDCCYTGRLKLTGDNRLIEGSAGQEGLFDIPHSDMSWALGMASGATQVLQGWWGEVPKGDLSKFNKFSIDEWTKFKEGDNLYDALMYAIQHGDPDPLEEGPLETYRLKGQGDLTEVRIE